MKVPIQVIFVGNTNVSYVIINNSITDCLFCLLSYDCSTLLQLQCLPFLEIGLLGYHVFHFRKWSTWSRMSLLLKQKWGYIKIRWFLLRNWLNILLVLSLSLFSQGNQVYGWWIVYYLEFVLSYLLLCFWSIFKHYNIFATEETYLTFHRLVGILKIIFQVLVFQSSL